MARITLTLALEGRALHLFSLSLDGTYIFSLSLLGRGLHLFSLALEVRALHLFSLSLEGRGLGWGWFSSKKSFSSVTSPLPYPPCQINDLAGNPGTPSLQGREKKKGKHLRTRHSWMVLSSPRLSPRQSLSRGLNYWRAKASGFPIKDLGNDEKRSPRRESSTSFSLLPSRERKRNMWGSSIEGEGRKRKGIIKGFTPL